MATGRLITATFKTPEGEIEARAQSQGEGEGAVAIAWMTDVHVNGDWTLVRDADGFITEWRHGGLVVAAPTDSELSEEKKLALRRATRSMLAWMAS